MASRSFSALDTVSCFLGIGIVRESDSWTAASPYAFWTEFLSLNGPPDAICAVLDFCSGLGNLSGDSSFLFSEDIWTVLDRLALLLSSFDLSAVLILTRLAYTSFMKGLAP